MKIKFLTRSRIKHILYLFLFFSFFLIQNSQAQNNFVVSGVVIDAGDQMTLPGATVLEKGTSNGTATDFDGNFSLTVSSKNAVIVISSVGYVTQTIPLAGKNNISVSMKLDTQSLDEVILIGYGSSKKSDLTGSVAVVSGEEINKRYQ